MFNDYTQQQQQQPAYQQQHAIQQSSPRSLQQGGFSEYDDEEYMDAEKQEEREVLESLQEKKPRVLLMGLRRSGKSSILKVVFHKMQPNETLFLESTSRLGKNDILSFIDFQIWDFPGHINLLDSPLNMDMIFSSTGAIVFVIDSQDDYIESLQRLFITVMRAYKVNPNISFEVFIHKVDGLSDDHKIETQRDIQARIMDELMDAGLETVHLSFYLTSIYDHSIYESFSKVIQKLIPQLPTLERLLDGMNSNSAIEKSFLFDTYSKIYIATDSSPVDTPSYEICSDMIDVVLDVISIYSSSPTPTIDPQTSTTIHLSNSLILWLRAVTSTLVLVCLVRSENFEKQGLIEYNFKRLREGVRQTLEVANIVNEGLEGGVVTGLQPVPGANMNAFSGNGLR